MHVVGAGLPRTGTTSLRVALEQLLGGRVYHMSTIPGHPFDLGADWNRALAGEAPAWERIFAGYVAAVDWPASLFWRELSAANPEALVLLSVRDSAEVWRQSFEATILPIARQARSLGWPEGRSLAAVLERFVGDADWANPATWISAYERHNAEVREAIPPGRLLEWRAEEGWGPICRALDIPVPDAPFPWTGRRAEFG
jgi:hypothetical protein